jgi:hypothetical protein
MAAIGTPGDDLLDLGRADSGDRIERIFAGGVQEIEQPILLSATAPGGSVVARYHDMPQVKRVAEQLTMIPIDARPLVVAVRVV